jgi:hypothetical protein
MTLARIAPTSHVGNPALVEVALVAGVSAAGAEDWQASAWLLSRRWPRRWGLPTRQG